MPLRKNIPWRDLAVFGGFALLSVIFTWPLAIHFSTHVPGVAGDNFEYVWKLWWVPHALFDLHVSPLFQPDIYYPYGYPLAYGDLTPAHTYLLMPLTRLIGEVATYNLVVLLSAPMTGWATYRLARRWLARRGADAVEWGAFFAGAAFAFCAYRLVHLQLHLELLDTQWIVLTVWGLDRWLETHAYRDAALVGIGAGLAALGSWYYGLMLAMMLPVYLLAFRPGLRSLLTSRRVWAGAALAVGIAAAMCIPFAVPYLQLKSQDPRLFDVPASQASFWAASPLDYLLPNLYNPLWGAAVRHLAWPLPGDPPLEFGGASTGLVTILLAIFGARRVVDPSWRAVGWVGAVALMLSLGPELHLGRLPTGLPLPVAALRLLPVFESLRTWGRFSLFVELAMCLAAGAGLTSLLRWVSQPQRRAALGAALVAAVVLESAAWPVPLAEVGPRPVDTWLASQPGDFAIMQYPLPEALTGQQMLYTRYHGKKIVFGYGTYLPFVYTQRHPDLLTFPDDPALDQLAAWGVRYVVVDARATYDPAVGRVGGQPRLKHVITLDGQAVYELSGSGP